MADVKIGKIAEFGDYSAIMFTVKFWVVGY